MEYFKGEVHLLFSYLKRKYYQRKLGWILLENNFTKVNIRCTCTLRESKIDSACVDRQFIYGKSEQFITKYCY